MFNINKEREVIDAQFSKFKNDYINFKNRDVSIFYYINS